MELTWKYVIEVTSTTVFEDFKKRYSIDVPDDMQALILKANAGTPSKIKIKADNGKERILGAILSFNEDDDDNVYTAMEIEHNKRYLPFAVDPFGNYFYQGLFFGDIIFVDHETEEVSKISDSLENMLNELY